MGAGFGRGFASVQKLLPQGPQRFTEGSLPARPALAPFALRRFWGVGNFAVADGFFDTRVVSCCDTVTSRRTCGPGRPGAAVPTLAVAAGVFWLLAASVVASALAG